MKLRLVACLALIPLACGGPGSTHAHRMNIVASEERADLDRIESRFVAVRARLAEAQPTAAAEREIGPRVQRLLVDVEAHLRAADEHLDVALIETSHEHFLKAQEASGHARRGVRQLEELAPAMGAPDHVVTR